MADMSRDNLVQRIRVRRGVADKTLMIANMVAAKFHFGVEREMLSVLCQRLHVFAEGIVSTSCLRKHIRKKAVPHTYTKQSFDVRMLRIGTILPKALQ